MRFRLALAAFLGLPLVWLPLAEEAKASDLEYLCGDYSFLGGAKAYVGRMSNGRQNGLVLFDARSESGRVLTLYAWGKRPDGSGGEGCSPIFGKVDGNTLVVRYSRTKATYTFDGSGKASLEWLRTHKNGKREKLTAQLEESQ